MQIYHIPLSCVLRLFHNQICVYLASYYSGGKGGNSSSLHNWPHPHAISSLLGINKILSRGIGGQSLNLHSLHIRDNKAVYLHRHPRTHVLSLRSITTTYKNICFDFLLRCLWYMGLNSKLENGLKTKKWTQNSKMGNWPLWAHFLGRCSSAPPILLFLGPGELPKGGPK